MVPTFTLGVVVVVTANVPSNHMVHLSMQSKNTRLFVGCYGVNKIVRLFKVS